ncbi:hypothetical protein [Pseudomonas fragi]|uniref:hypothetical protein n=1 Tax=Pseudomonas fragi TaxID=296 RepID=UPI00030EA429|nr:hypothetical protein [Pseudomonas fragi]
MNTASRLLCLLPLIASAAVADTYPQQTLIDGSMVRWFDGSMVRWFASRLGIGATW